MTAEVATPLDRKHHARRIASLLTLAGILAALVLVPAPRATALDGIPSCDVPSTTPTEQQVARIDYGASKADVDQLLGSVGTLAFRGTKYTTYDYGIADCAPGFATVKFGRWQKALRVVTVKWIP